MFEITGIDYYNVTYRLFTIEMHTWNLYNPINKCQLQ